MRVLIWGMIVVFGFAVSVAAISVHGSVDERAAIRRAVRAPLLDLRHRDASRLCDDFTVAAEAHIASGAGSCDSRLAEDFRIARTAVLYPSPDGRELLSRLRVNAISWSGNRATAISSYPGARSSVRHWRLQRVGDAWRIATPATLRLRAQCPGLPPIEHACTYALSMRLAGASSAG